MTQNMLILLTSNRTAHTQFTRMCALGCATCVCVCARPPMTSTYCKCSDTVSMPFNSKLFKRVPAGTNGGITLKGTIWSALGGAFIGCVYYSLLVNLEATPEVSQLYIVPLGLFGGLLGSMVDSVLGATLQYSGYCSVRRRVVERPSATATPVHGTGYDVLTGSQVNLLAASLTAVCSGYAAVWIFGCE